MLQQTYGGCFNISYVRKGTFYRKIKNTSKENMYWFVDSKIELLQHELFNNCALSFT